MVSAANAIIARPKKTRKTPNHWWYDIAAFHPSATKTAPIQR
jgi:hypothetical protein